MKRFLWSLSGILAAVLMFFASSSSAFADSISFVDEEPAQAKLVNARQPQINSSNTKYTTKLGKAIYFDYNVVPNAGGVYGLQYQIDKTIKKGDIVSFSINISATSAGTTRVINSLRYYGMSSYDFYIRHQELVADPSHNTYYIFVEAEYHGEQGPTDTLNFTYGEMDTPIFDVISPEGFILVARVTTSAFNIGTPVDGKTLQTALENINKGLKIDADTSGLATSKDQQATTNVIQQGNQQAHQDNQAQLNWDKQQAQKEEEQRKEDENKANSAGSDSQSSADDSQSNIDSGTGSFFSIINGVKDSILQGSNKNNCSISGDFGVFNVGSINLCTGGDKVKPITNIVGTVMLAFFTFNAAITVIKQFYELYMETMR